MASHLNHTVFPLLQQLESPHHLHHADESDDDYEHLNSASPSSSSAPVLPLPDPSSTVTIAALPNAAPLSISTPSTTLAVDSTLSDSKRLHVLTILHQDKKPLDESRRLFQRLWTDEDEIELLQGFLHYSTQRGSTHHHDTSLFYDQIKSKLQLHFNKSQLVEKLRRLKKKYRNVLSKLSSGKDFSFKTPHDQATFEISSKIWSDMARIAVEDTALEDVESIPNPSSNPNINNCMVKEEEIVANTMGKKTPRSRKRPLPQSSFGPVEKPALNCGSAAHNNNINGGTNNMVCLIEKTVNTCLSPLFKEFLSSNAIGDPSGARGFGEMALNPMPFSFGFLGSMKFGGGDVLDEKWRKQQILELEVYSKRLELVQDQIKMTLEELQSARGS